MCRRLWEPFSRLGSAGGWKDGRTGARSALEKPGLLCRVLHELPVEAVRGKPRIGARQLPAGLAEPSSSTARSSPAQQRTPVQPHLSPPPTGTPSPRTRHATARPAAPGRAALGPAATPGCSQAPGAALREALWSDRRGRTPSAGGGGPKRLRSPLEPGAAPRPARRHKGRHAALRPHLPARWAAVRARRRHGAVRYGPARRREGRGGASESGGAGRGGGAGP